jgi:hypothetical protein
MHSDLGGFSMRGYIHSIKTEEDDATGEPKVRRYTFCESISEAVWYPTRERAERELAIMDGGSRSITMDETGITCSDFRIEQRSENEFVVSCEGPTKSFT